MLILRLKQRFDELLRHETERVYPVEACALLFGILTENEAVVQKVEVTQNMLRSSTKFEVNPTEVAMAVTEAEKEGLEFVGLFHSHPAPASPSKTDLDVIRLWPDTVWLILSSTESSMAAFQLTDGKIENVAIRID